MSLLYISILATIALTIQEAIEYHARRVKLARRRARRYTFN